MAFFQDEELQKQKAPEQAAPPRAPAPNVNPKRVAEFVRSNPKVPKEIARLAGVKPKDLNQQNIKGASQILEGSLLASSKGADPEGLPPAELKKTAGYQSEGNEKDETAQKLIAKAIIGLAPAIIGAAVGGARAGAMSAEGGKEGLQFIEREEERGIQKNKEKQAMAFAEQKEKREERRVAALEKGLEIKEKGLATQERVLDKKLQLAQDNVKKRLNVEESKVAQTYQRQFNQDNIGDRYRNMLAAAQQAKLLVLEGGPVAPEAIKTVVRKLMGDSGNIGHQEAQRVGGSQAILPSLERWATIKTSGEFTDADRVAFMKIAGVFEKSARQELEKVAKHHASQYSAAYPNISEAEAARRIGASELLQKTENEASLENKFINKYLKTDQDKELFSYLFAPPTAFAGEKKKLTPEERAALIEKLKARGGQ